MSDYIKREDALRAVYDITTYEARIPLDTAVFRIKEIPSADVVEVVRCKDCKWWDSEGHKCAIRDSYGWDYKPTDYCSFGERKDNE